MSHLIGECPRCRRADVLMMPDEVRLTLHDRPDGVACSMEPIGADGIMRFGDGHPKAVQVFGAHAAALVSR